MSNTLSNEQIFGKEPSRHILRNGLTVLFAPEHTAGLVSAQAWVKTGSIHEDKLLGSGISHYLEHLVFKGTQKYSCAELAKTVQAAGGTINAYTAHDRTVYHIDGPAECAELALDVLAEMTLRPRLDPEDAAREREVILREIDMRDDEPESILCEAVLNEVMRIHPLRQPIIGLRDAFAAITHDQILAYHRERYAPNNIVLVVAGALDEAALLNWAEKYFGNAPAGTVNNPAIPDEPEQLARRTATVSADVKVLRGCMTWRIPEMRHPDAPALNVFAMLLGNGESCRLHKKLHDDLGIVHDIGAHNWSPSGTGLLWLSYTANPDQRTAVEQAALDVVNSALRDGFDESEFAKARRACLMGFINSRKTVAGIAAQTGALAVILGEPAYPQRYLEIIEKLTPADVLNAARRHINHDKLTCVALEPHPKKSAAANTTPAASAGVSLAPFTETRLANGLRILLQPVRHFPKIHFRMVFLGGGNKEPANRRGITSLLATLLTRDTENRTAEQVAEAAEALGTSLSDTAGDNSFGISIETLASDASAGCALLADAILHHALNNETIELEREDQISALNENEDDVVEYGHKRLRELFFGENPLAISASGRKGDVAQITPPELRTLHAATVRPDNAVLAVTGDFNPETMLPALSAIFQNWKPAATTATAAANTNSAINSAPAKPFASAAKTGRINETRTCEQALVFLAFPDTGITAPDYVTGQLLDDLLSGMASQLFTSIREERGMAYFVGATRVSSLNDGMFYLYAGTAAQHVEEVLDAMKTEIARARAGKFTAEEIASSKARLHAAHRMGRQSLALRTSNAALKALYGMNFNDDAEFASRLNAQTAESIAEFVARYFAEDRSLAFVITPEK